jgi:hypothetical protein
MRRGGAVSKVPFKVIPNLFRNTNPLKMRYLNIPIDRDKMFRMMFREHIYTFDTASGFIRGTRMKKGWLKISFLSSPHFKN